MIGVARADEKWTAESDPEDLIGFREQDVEFLLDQAADLLDRILRDQAAFDALGEKLFDLQSLDEEIKSDDSTVDVVFPGAVNPFDETREVVKTRDLSTKASQEDFSSYFDNVPTLSAQATNYLNLRGGLANQKAVQVNAASIASGGNQGVIQTRDFELGMQDEQNAASQAAAAAGRIANARRARAAALRALIEEQNAKLNKGLQERKKSASAEINGALNFTERRAALQLRMDDDFRQVKARVVKARVGLREIYGYEREQPLSDESIGLYDRYVVWVRRAISFLVTITRRDQEFSLAVSLRALANNSWADQLALGRFSFRITSAAIKFPSFYRLIRLRGVSLSLRYRDSTGNATDLWNGDIEITTSRGTAARCHAGRIRERNGTSEPDLLGEVLLHNVNPFSNEQVGVDWTITLTPSSLAGQSLTTVVDDILLDLRVAAQLSREN